MALQREEPGMGEQPMQYLGVNHVALVARDPNGIHLELAALTRAFGPHDLAHDPVDAQGKHVRQREPAATAG